MFFPVNTIKEFAEMSQVYFAKSSLLLGLCAVHPNLNYNFWQKNRKILKIHATHLFITNLFYRIVQKNFLSPFSYSNL